MKQRDFGIEIKDDVVGELVERPIKHRPRWIYTRADRPCDASFDWIFGNNNRKTGFELEAKVVAPPGL